MNTSKCCNSDLITHTSDEGTGYYSCSQCGKPTDAKPELCEHGLPLFQSCDKCGREMVNDEPFKKGVKKIAEMFSHKPDTTNAEWEKEIEIFCLDLEVGNIDDKESRKAWRNDLKTFIRSLLDKQNKQYEAEIDREKELLWERIAANLSEINKLKQQHKEELESLKMERKAAIEMSPISEKPTDKLVELVLLKEGYNQAVKELNVKIDKLLNRTEDKKECENCGTEDNIHKCVECDDDITEYVCTMNSGMCHHCQWLIGK